MICKECGEDETNHDLTVGYMTECAIESCKKTFFCFCGSYCDYNHIDGKDCFCTDHITIRDDGTRVCQTHL